MIGAIKPARDSAQAWRIGVQVLLAVVVGGLIYGAFVNAADNLQREHIASGFRFWNNSAGFDISQTLIP
jgi:general L-amino acid transport system permease protein